MKDKIKFIKEIATIMNENKVNTVKYEDNNFEIEINKKTKEKRSIILGNESLNFNNSPSQLLQKDSEVEMLISENKEKNSVEEIKGIKIESPMVGTFYSSPSPEAEPFIKEGDTVVEGQTLCIVEAMKLMNEVKSTVSGKVIKIIVKDGEPIKKGQVLVIIE